MKGLFARLYFPLRFWTGIANKVTSGHSCIAEGGLNYGKAQRRLSPYTSQVEILFTNKRNIGEVIIFV